MKKYSVVLRGEDFEVIFEGEERDFGFYTTRVVKAKNEDEAEVKAVELINTDRKLLALMKKDLSKKPMVFLESITKVPFWRRLGGAGYTFWPMEREDENL